MLCEKCDGDTKIIDSRCTDGNVTRRRHECLECGHRFSTVEIPTSILDQFIKDRVKIVIKPV